MHEHEHAHDCEPKADGHAMSKRKMAAAVALTTLFVIGEAVAGYFTHSLALLSDAGHNLADALALGLSWYALSIATKPSDSQRTFGYHRVAILAALGNAVSLVVIALIIFWKAAQRLGAPHEVHSGPMIVMALVAIAVNGIIAMWLHHGAKHDVNVRSAYLHMLGDAASAFGVVIAGIVIALTGRFIADPIASLLIGALILWSSWGILKETIHILLEGSPLGLNMDDLEKTIRAVDGVLNFHDLHVWTVGPGVIACSCHIVVAAQSIQSGQKIMRAVAEELEHDFNINHATIQVEVEACEADEMYCHLHPTHTDAGHHHHH